MSRLIILAIALAITSIVNANDMNEGTEALVSEIEALLAEIEDEDDYYYICPFVFFPNCEGLKKGDALDAIMREDAIRYCDADRPIISDRIGDNKRYWCIYNGKEIKASNVRHAK